METHSLAGQTDNKVNKDDMQRKKTERKSSMT